MSVESFLSKLPAHKASLYLTHNEHLSNYQTVLQAVKDNDHGYKDEDWISPEQKELAIQTNECWTLQWYPETPVGFYSASAATLEALLEFVSNDK